MGIPGFFSSIIKNYGNIIKNASYHKTNSTIFHSLFMDCNSIVYDAYYQLSKIYTGSPTAFETALIQNVIGKIEDYIVNIKPVNVLYIAFDGVAPFAKMDQQRTRRYKSWYNSTISLLPDNTSFKWNTASITPGTSFMSDLSSAVKLAFHNANVKYAVNKIVVSTSDEPGEGEHKMFQYIRDHSHMNDNVMVYGLDADLIMLSIFHYNLCKNIYVFREAPEFIKSKVIDNVSPHELLFMDIRILSTSIINELDCAYNDPHRIYDYIFMCFFLGNDFLPHFPVFNIRTTGIQILLDTYRCKIGGHYDRFFISKKTFHIQWKWVRLFISELASNEYSFILQEYEVRNKMEHYQFPHTTPEEKEKMMSNVPIIYRAHEKYICPEEVGWERRYYKSLFSMKTPSDHIGQLCHNYMEGLEWVFKYYTTGCPDWKWKYNYNYPPLLTDLLKYIPQQEMNFISSDSIFNRPFHPTVQLAYVLPPAYHNLLQPDVCSHINAHYILYYPTEFSFQWSFCRYFWEAHVLLPEIPIEILEKWDMDKRFQ